MTQSGVRVAVAGGSGLVGRYVVQALRSAGHEPVVLARSAGVDLVTGEGVEAAMDGVERVVDVSNVATLRRATATAFFEAVTARLLTAGRQAGVRHHVTLSIVGVDRVAFGYYQAKLRQEQLVLGSAAPVTVLRATQFHEFADQQLQRGGPLGGTVAVVPRMRCQPVAAREVASALAELVVAEPAGLAPELAGPRPEDLPDMVRRLLHARGVRRRVVVVPVPGAAGQAMAQGELLPTGPGPRGTQTFDEWLADA